MSVSVLSILHVSTSQTISTSKTFTQLQLESKLGTFHWWHTLNFYDQRPADIIYELRHRVDVYLVSPVNS